MKSIIGNEEIIVHVYDKPSMKNFGDFNFDKTVESISVTSNLEELEKLVSSSFGTGASMNFTSATPPFSINPRWVKKITYRTK